MVTLNLSVQQYSFLYIMAVLHHIFLGFILKKAPFRPTHAETPTTASHSFSLLLWLSLFFVGHCSYFIQGLFAALGFVPWMPEIFLLPYSSLWSFMGRSVDMHLHSWIVNHLPSTLQLVILFGPRLCYFTFVTFGFINSYSKTHYSVSQSDQLIIVHGHQTVYACWLLCSSVSPEIVYFVTYYK